MTTAPRPAVLLVDDDEDDLFALDAALGPLGLELAKALDGDAALRLLLERDFAAVVMDLMMPRMNGFETAALIRRRGRHQGMPILILTGFDMDGMRTLPGFHAEGLEFLNKPVDPEALRAKVAELVSRAVRAPL